MNIKLQKLFTVIILTLATAAFVPGRAGAQTVPPLERTVTISFHREKMEEVLSRLSKVGQFTFSYSPDIIEDDGTITASFRHKTVREILNQIFHDKVSFKERGKYIILTRSSAQSQRTAAPMIITGYVQNEDTGLKIPAVSIYEKNTLSASVSDRYGFFELKIDKPSAQHYISVNKKDFKDTVVTVDHTSKKFLVVPLQPSKKYDVDLLRQTRAIPDTLGDIKRDPDEWKTTLRPVANQHLKPQQINMQNIRDTLYRDAQISFVPFAGTNHILSGNVVNDYSYNIIGGYSMGTRKAEFGGVFNVARGDVSFFQYAGVFNSTLGGNVSGVQVAGVFNTNLSKMEGLQYAGVLNANGRKSRGTQVAGVLNVQFQGFKGPQFAGVMNVNTGASRGVLFAGVLNVQVGGYEGPQFAGVMNFNTGASRGAQLAGVLNMQVKDHKGPQIAGVMNVASHSTGSQIAGVVNYGREVRGVQLGVINIADTVRGVPLGVLSFVRKGYHALEFSVDEIFYSNLAFRTGVRSFYNILSVGIKPGTFGDPLWSMGYGIGTMPRLTRNLYLNIDLTSHHVSKGHLFFDKLSSLNKLYVGVQFPIYKKLSLTMGATLNAYITDRDEEYPDLFADYDPSVTERAVGNSSLMQMWWGGKIGVRLF